MASNTTNTFRCLIADYEQLLEHPMTDELRSGFIREWQLEVSNVLEGMFGGRKSDEAKGFRIRVASPDGQAQFLRGLLSRLMDEDNERQLQRQQSLISLKIENNNSNTVSVSNVVEFSQHLMSQIDESPSLTPQQKSEAKEAVEIVRDELQNRHRDWGKIKNGLKRMIDVGLEYTPKLIELAAAVAKAQG